MAYDFHYGETDLYENDLKRIGQRYTIGTVLILLLVFGGGLAFVLTPSLLATANDIAAGLEPQNTNTPTPRPTFDLPTVTPAPPTLTPTDTPPPSPTPTATEPPPPCLQEVSSGDTLYGLASLCGHLSFDIIPVIVEANSLPDANSLQIGQILEIPWPTVTPDPNAAPVEAPPASGENAVPADDNDASVSANTDDDGEAQPVSAFDENFDPLFVPTATLQPGVMFYIVQPGDNMLNIAVQYGADIEIMSQLNPEVTFTQCDFGVLSGGPRCSAPVAPGQRLRVPAPTPTPTLPPTLTGSETATPTATATFNAPSAQSPSDRAHFLIDQLVTLRWIPSGTLAPGEVYRIDVTDLTTNTAYSAETFETSFIIPLEWQGTTEPRHEFQWSVSVINQTNPENPSFTTESRTFTWEGRPEEG